MAKYIIKRILWVIPVMLGVIVIVYTLSYNMKGFPAVNRLKVSEYGLNQPYIVQLGMYIWKLFTKLDMGQSYFSNYTIVQQLAIKIPVTFKISLLGILLMMAVGLPCGMISALRQYSVLDIGMTSVSLFLSSIPAFVLAILCALFFGVVVRWLPVTGLATWRSWILPVVCSSVGGLATYLRMTRTTMLEVIRQDYITTARAKGLKEHVVVRRHALRNCLIPLTTVIGLFVASMFSGSIIVETIFTINGMGLFLLDGILARDYPVINGTVVSISLLVCLANLLVDIAYAFIDPRIRAQFETPRKKY